MRKILYFSSICLLVVAVFDPADKVTHLKLPLFVAVWVITVISYSSNRRPQALPLSLLVYLLGVSFVIPISSICWYFSQNGTLERFDGFQYLKSYLFLTLCIPLALERLELVQPLSVILSVQALLTSLIYMATSYSRILFEIVYRIGNEYGILVIGDRTFGESNFSRVYFPTSPLLVIPVSYFTYKCITSKGRTKVLYLFLIAGDIVGMVLSGTRNNAIAGVTTCLAVWLWYSKRKTIVVCLGASIIGALAVLNWGTIQAMFSPGDESNATKLQHFRDYSLLLSNPVTLVFGQGLGAYFNSTEYGYTSVTELTYMDLLRNYGIVLGVPMLSALVYPLGNLARRRCTSEHFLFLAYASYLYLCIANPFLVSSSGMLVLAIVVTKTFPCDVLKRNSLISASFGLRTKCETV